MIRELGKHIDNKDSVYYWCYLNNIPVYCPAITDGAIGDMLFTFSFRHPEFIMDTLDDYSCLLNLANSSTCTGAIILGSGLVSNHILGVNR